MPDAPWRRIAGFRVVVSWPQAGYAPPPATTTGLRARLAGIAGALLIMAGTAVVGVVVSSQVHAPQPSLSEAGVIGDSSQGRGDAIDVRLADGVTAVFRVTGVREYSKSRFPSKAIYGATGFAALRLITCGGAFDYATGHYLSSTVVFASLASSRHRSY